MTKRLVALAFVAAAFVLPATPASAHPICVPLGTFELICLTPE